MTSRLATLSLLAFALVLGYAAYLQPGWESYRDDQRQYVLLAQGLAARGEFTRAPVGDQFVPEPLRTPGYPLLLAPLCATVGCDHWQIAGAQAVVAAGLPLLAYLLALRWGRRIAFACAAACAFYLPFAYYAALALADFAATALMLVGLVLTSRARTIKGSLVAGAVLGFLGLTRPQFLVFPLAAALAVVLTRDGARLRDRIAPAAGLVIAAALVLVPFNMYSLAYFGGPFASSSGTGLWWGYFQGRGAEPAKVQQFRESSIAGASDERIEASGASIGLDPIESREAAGAFRELAAFDAISDRTAQAYAWIDLNRSLTRRALVLIAHDPAGYVLRGLTTRTIELWAGELPIRIDDLRNLPPLPRALSTAAQLVLFAAGAAGAVLLGLRREREGLLVAATILYTWLVLIVFVTEPRYSLPARPALLVGAVFAVALLARRGASSQRTKAAMEATARVRA